MARVACSEVVEVNAASGRFRESQGVACVVIATVVGGKGGMEKSLQSATFRFWQ